MTNVFPFPSMKNPNQTEPEHYVYTTQTKHKRNFFKVLRSQNPNRIKEPKPNMSPKFWVLSCCTLCLVHVFSLQLAKTLHKLRTSLLQTGLYNIIIVVTVFIDTE